MTQIKIEIKSILEHKDCLYLSKEFEKTYTEKHVSTFSTSFLENFHSENFNRSLNLRKQDDVMMFTVKDCKFVKT